MAEIKVERKRGILPWIIGLILLVLVALAVSRSMRHDRTVDEDRGAAAADALRDNTPLRLRQYAQIQRPKGPSYHSPGQRPGGGLDHADVAA